MEIIIIAILFIVVEGIFFISMKSVPDRQKQVIFAWLIFIQLFLPAAFRSVDVYNDSIAYATHFTDISPYNVLSVNMYERFEVGYQILENFIYLKIFKSPLALFIITSFFIQLSYVIFFKKYSSVFWFSIFLYLGLCHYFFTVSAIRQGIAIGIFNFAFVFLIKKRWIWYLLFIILAAQFHSSIYLLVLLPFLSKLQISKKNLVYYIVILLAGLFLLNNILGFFFSFFPNYGTVYIEKEYISESKTGISFILISYIIGLFFVLRNFDFKNHSEQEKYMLFFYLILVMLLVFSIRVSVIARFTHYFIPVSIVMLANSCHKIKNISNRMMAYLFWIIFLTVEVAVILVYRPEWFMVTPYKLYWQ